MRTVVIVSGYFNPIHIGHVRMLAAAREMGDHVVAIVNNDVQQMLKKGQIIIPEDQRVTIVQAIRHVDEVVLSTDTDPTIRQTLASVASRYPGDHIIFGNGGDRDTAKVVPEEEVCREHGIEMVFGVGGTDKPHSSTEINRAIGIER